MNIGKRIASNTGFLFFSSIFEKMCKVVFVAYAARMLGPIHYGTYALVGAFVFIVAQFTNLGILPMSIREIARNKDNAEQLFNNVLSLRIHLLFINYIILFIGLYFVNYDRETRFLIYISSISFLSITFSSCFRGLFMAFERMAIPSFVFVLHTLFSVVFGCLALFLGYGLIGLIVVQVIVGILRTVILGVFSRKMFFRFRYSFQPAIWFDMVKQAIPFGLISFFQQTNKQLIIILLSKISGPIPANEAIGYYNPASSAPQSGMIVPNSLRQAMLPAIASNRDNRDLVTKVMDRTTKYTLILVCFPLIMITTVFPTQILGFVFGTKFLPAAPALVILGWAYAIHAFNTPIAATLSSSREISRFVPWIAMETILSLILVALLISHFGFVGAAAAFLVSRLFGSMGRFYLLKSVWHIGLRDLKESCRVFMPMTLVLVLMYLLILIEVNKSLVFCLPVVLFVILIVVLRIGTRRELRFIMDTIVQYMPFISHQRNTGEKNINT